MSESDLTWEYEGIFVAYQQHLDGDGRSMAGQFTKLIEDRYSDRLPFETCYEWCSGPGFIGFALLAKNLCKNLVLADINPEAIAMANRTIVNNNLEHRVRIYESDNLKQIPKSERFDLVVSNPPNFYCLNPLHPSYSSLVGDLRPNDPGWKIHLDFYNNIGAYLNPNAILCIEEVDPYAVKSYMPNVKENQPLWGPEPFDIRPRPPILDFKEMIARGGLTFDDVVILPEKSVPVHVLLSHYSGSSETGNIRIKSGIKFFEQVGQLENGNYRLAGVDDDKITGHVDIPDEQLWLVSIIELLINAGEDGLPASQLTMTLDLPADHVESAITMLKKMGWVI